MSLTQGNVVITCAGKAPLRFREGTRVSCVLSVAAKAFEPGSFNSADGYAVTPDRPLAAGQYAYNCGKSDEVATLKAKVETIMFALMECLHIAKGNEFARTGRINALTEEVYNECLELCSQSVWEMR